MRGKKLKALTDQKLESQAENIYTAGVTKLFENIKANGLQLDTDLLNEGKN